MLIAADQFQLYLDVCKKNRAPAVFRSAEEAGL